MRSAFRKVHQRMTSTFPESTSLRDDTASDQTKDDGLCTSCQSLTIERLCRPKRFDFLDSDESSNTDEAANGPEWEDRPGHFNKPKLTSLAPDCKLCELLGLLCGDENLCRLDSVRLCGGPYRGVMPDLSQARILGLRETATMATELARLGTRHMMRNSPRITAHLERFDPISRISVEFRLRRQAANPSDRPVDLGDEPFEFRKGHLKVTIHPDEQPKLENAVAGRTTYPATSSHTPKLINCWLDNCLSKHARCHENLVGQNLDDKNGNVLLPTRLVDVGSRSDPSALRLITTTVGQKGQYIALSYCWGQGTPLKLLKANLGEFLVGIPSARLPKTIKEAVDLVRALDYRYIWIDSLCIVQDSQEEGEDWPREARRMGQYYSNALLIIAALASNSSDEGLYRSSDTSPHLTARGASATLPYTLNGRRLGHMTIRLPHQTSSNYDFEYEKRASPWYKRGWVVQERTLARRLVYFGAHQLYWECREDIRAEDGDIPISHKRYTAPWGFQHDPNTDEGSAQWADKKDFHISYNAIVMSKVFRMMREKLERPTGKGISKLLSRSTQVESYRAKRKARFEVLEFSAIFNAWTWLVESYCSCSLTHQADRLIAIEGIAQVLCSATGSTHYWGLWLEVVEKGLLWRGKTALTNSGLKQAPSWSWAAWDQAIEFPFRCFGYSKTLKPGFEGATERAHLVLATDVWDALSVKRAAVILKARTCKECNKYLDEEEEHLECSLCDDGAYTLCLVCAKVGARCPGSDSHHSLSKRVLRDGYMTDSINEDLPPRMMIQRKPLVVDERPNTGDQTEKVHSEHGLDPGGRSIHKSKQVLYGRDDSQGSMQKKAALWYSLTGLSESDDTEYCCSGDICRHRWVYHHEWPGPIGLVEFDQACTTLDTVSCIVLKYDYLDTASDDGRGKDDYDEEVEDEEDENDSSAEERDSHVANEWESETGEDSDDNSAESRAFDEHFESDMSEATVPVLACVKTATENTYKRVGIGVVFDMKHKFWIKAFRASGYPSPTEGDGYISDADVVLV